MVGVDIQRGSCCVESPSLHEPVGALHKPRPNDEWEAEEFEGDHYFEDAVETGFVEEREFLPVRIDGIGGCCCDIAGFGV